MSTHLKSALSEPVLYVSRDPAIDVVEVAPPKPKTRAQRLAAARASTQALADRRRNRALAACCSDYWIREKMAGRRVYPSTPCRCAHCRGRRQWPGNGYVSGAGYAFDCQLERQPEDPDLAEVLEELRGGSASVMDAVAMKHAQRNGRQYRGGIDR